VRSGAQAVLIVIDENGAEKLLDVLAVLPSNAAQAPPLYEPAYASALAVAEAYYKSEITAAQKAAFMKELPTLELEDWPYARESPDFLRPRLDMTHDLAIRADPTGELASIIQAITTEWFGGSGAGVLWHPLHLLEGHAAEDRKESWRILTMWRKWLNEGLNPKGQAAAWLQREPSKNEMKAFHRRLKYLGLKE